MVALKVVKSICFGYKFSVFGGDFFWIIYNHFGLIIIIIINKWKQWNKGYIDFPIIFDTEREHLAAIATQL